MRSERPIVRARPHPLALTIALALAGTSLTAPSIARSATLPVTSCADDGSPGTLRSVIASAHDGDVVDMTQLTCSTITLQLGEIVLHDSVSLTFNGPGQDRLVISGADTSPLLYFPFFSGRITLRDLTLAHGRLDSGSYLQAACLTNRGYALDLERVTLTDCHSYVGFGGAVSSGYFLTLIDSTITHSSARADFDGGSAGGGGAWAGSATLIRSTISGNEASSRSATGSAAGGGLVASDLVMVDSTITDNSCVATYDAQGCPGGGVFVDGNTTLLRSTIAGNSADGDGGGLFKGDTANGTSASFTIQDSTIANNTAGRSGGALYSQWPVTVTNSTIADNASALGGAVRLRPFSTYFGTSWPDFESTIIAGNTTGPGAPYAADLSSTASLTVFGANNLIGDTGAEVTLPPDTLRGDPMLLPLADNGGLTETMALAPGSPAIDTGSNLLGFVADQRGGDFVRAYGVAADIGAYEVQPPPLRGPGRRASTPPIRTNATVNGAPSRLPVTSCADDGSSGTLRAVAARAHDGDTLDMTQLTCSTITLEHGAIDLSTLGPNPLRSVTLAGPGADALTISAQGNSAVVLAGGLDFYRQPGTVTLSGLTLAHGAKYDVAACVTGFSTYLVLDDVTVTDCHSRRAGGGGNAGGGGAVSGRYEVSLTDSTVSDSSITAIDRNVASGGGLWAYQATLIRSTVSGNSVSAPMAYAYQGYRTGGGGVYTSGRATLIDSTISGNSVEATVDGQNANGGGVAARLGLTISGSTFSDNTADGIGGGAINTFPHYQLQLPNAPQSMGLPITNSTFTGNSAVFGSALASNDGTPIFDSTIAFNTSQIGGALAIFDGGTALQDYTLYLDSTIIAGNTIDGPGGHAADLAASTNLTLTVIGAHNLIGSADPNVTLPPDTISTDPMLLPLADNGGPTWTMALAVGSPAIDTGANPLALDTDQRGEGYVRVAGAAADIGAYEVQTPGDVIFVDGFDP